MLRAFIDHNWIIDNYEYDYAKRQFKRLRGTAYYGTLPFDRDSNGIPDGELTYYSDLVLRHELTEGVIWICTRDIMPKQEKIDDDVFLGHYIESLAGKQRMLCGDVFGFAKNEKRFSARVIKKESVSVGLNRGTAVTIELNEPKDREFLIVGPYGRARVIFTRIDSTIEVWKLACDPGKRDYKKPGKVLLIMGYFNSIEHFGAHIKDFEFFKEQIFY
jgi:hypothetical protein